ncbi:INO80 complex subunit 1 [Frankliniella fusca]|uniref:INO80 complex subunit 1 n=1 Tax=Frankliniella fusca TaxID=407009 RepID=A0AAE1LAS5_9NEOP|nr:INO80 complex subunit 1 [Frankliniella fusca]
MGIFCHKCDCNIKGGIDTFNEHLKLRGHNVPFFCSEGECDRTRIEHKNSFIRHLKNFHEREIRSSDSEESDEDNSSNEQRSSQQDSHNDEEYHNQEHDDNESLVSSESLEEGRNCQTEVELEKIAARYTMDLKKNGNVTDKAIDAVIQETTALLGKVLKFAVDKIRANLNEGRGEILDESVIDKSLDVFIGDPFYRLQTKEERLLYYRNFFGYIAPEPKFVGKYRYENRFDRKKNCTIQKQIPCNFQQISMIETLTAIVNNPMLFKLIQEEKKSSDGRMRWYLDGEKGRSHPVIAKYPNIIRLTWHGDDFENVNAEGAKTIIHKLVALHFLIQNLPAEENSRLRALHLLSYAYRVDLNKGEGIDVLLDSLFQELEQLQSEEGVPIMKCGEPFTLRAILVNCMGDAAAAHEMLGLLPPAANCFCWLCTVNRQDLHSNIFARGEKRTSELHNSHLQAIERLGPPAQKYYGIERQSTLITSSKHAEFPQAFIRDCMHDILKGIGPMELKLSLHEYVAKKKYFDSDFVNARLGSFIYGPADSKNKPSANFSDKSLSVITSYGLRQSAAQTWLLIQVFPFLFGSKVPDGDPHMRLIVLLKRMCEIIFSPVFSPHDIETLENLIFQHHSLFSLLYPPTQGNVEEGAGSSENNAEYVEDGGSEEEDDSEVDDPGIERTQPVKQNVAIQKKKKVVRPINKHHHILEYPDIMREFGPIVHYWCMRMEGKFALPERYASICGNFKDLPSTLADLHQTKHAADFMDWTCPVRDEITFSLSHVTSVEDIGHLDSFLQAGIERETVIEKLTSVTVGGFVYSPELYIVLPFQDNNMPLFGRIVFPFRAEGKFYVAFQNTELVTYDHKFGAYHVKNLSDRSLNVLLLKNLPPCRPMTAWTPYGSTSLYLSPRTYTFSDFVPPEDA